ncbi:23S rRNA (guanosine(2251)-2'-O)-methyltransferase RlmB [Ruminococcaceae bacterium OttesenSCG-928-A16]|nr:23S rRNA (guanosine(2251)-2'-O)-methyltransferase RlmB [Ruminococcaceae bacterium OttesenSCG-928-A16]
MQQTIETEIIYGKNAVTELLKSETGVDTVLLADTLDAKVAGYFTALAKNAGAVVKTTRTEKLNNLCGEGKHQGVAAFAAQITYYSLEELLQKAAEQNTGPPFILLADGVEDPHNLGALMRTAFLCGAHGVVIPKRGAAAVTPVVLKASAGAAARLPVARVANIGEAIRRLKQQNVFIYCADMDGPPAFKQNLTGAIGLVVGAEGKGVSPLVKKLCDGVVSLPMAVQQGSGVDSFNVSVAGGIVLYEIYRQRQEAAPENQPQNTAF